MPRKDSIGPPRDIVMGIEYDRRTKEFVVFIDDPWIAGKEPYYYTHNPNDALIKMIERGNSYVFALKLRVLLSEDKVTRYLWNKFYLDQNLGINSAIEY